jgi:hypothetical protein
MCRERLTVVIAIVTLLNYFTGNYGEELEAKRAGAKLPMELDSSTAAYDGIDSVYIFGGW